MMRWVCAGLAGLALALTAAGGAEGPAPAGTWKLLLSTGEGRMQPVALLRLQNAGGKWAAKVLARADGLPSLDIKDVTVGDGTLRGTVELGGASLRLECPLNADKDGRVIGGKVGEMPIEAAARHMKRLRQRLGLESCETIFRERLQAGVEPVLCRELIGHDAAPYTSVLTGASTECISIQYCMVPSKMEASDA